MASVPLCPLPSPPVEACCSGIRVKSLDARLKSHQTQHTMEMHPRTTAQPEHCPAAGDNQH